MVTRASTYVCIDCGYIVSDFEKLPGNYKCPVCNAPKRRFKPYSGGGGNDPKTMKKRMQEIKNGGGSASSGGSDANGAVAIVAGGAVLLAALYFGLSATYN